MSTSFAETDSFISISYRALSKSKRKSFESTKRQTICPSPRWVILVKPKLGHAFEEKLVANLKLPSSEMGPRAIVIACAERNVTSDRSSNVEYFWVGNE